MGHLRAADIRHALVTNSTSAAWILNPDSADSGTAHDAYILLDKRDIPPATATLLSAGMIHHTVDGIDHFFDRPDEPVEQSVRVSSPGGHVELSADGARRQVFDADLLEYLRAREKPVTVSAREELDRLLATHIAPGLRSLGFRKHGRSFAHRRGTILRLIYFSGSWTSDRHASQFDVTMAFWSDRVADLHPFEELYPGPRYHPPKSGVPAEHMCHWRGSLHSAFPRFAGARLECVADSDNTELAQTLRDAIFNHSVPYLDPIDSEAALLDLCLRTMNSSMGSPPLYVAALRRIVGPLKEYDAFVRSLVEDENYKPLNAKWATALRRMRRARVR